MMRWVRIALLWMGAMASGVSAGSGPARATEPLRVALWNGPAPIGNGESEDAEAWVTLHRAVEPNAAAVVICPGGGYGGLVVEPEGHGIAAWLNRHGIAGVVLEYRLPAGRCQVPLLDAQQAIRTVRTHAADWGIDPGRVGIMGFSAGGHLASTAGTRFDDGDVRAEATDWTGTRVRCGMPGRSKRCVGSPSRAWAVGAPLRRPAGATESAPREGGCLWIAANSFKRV